MNIRPEEDGDEAAIVRVTEAAFAHVPYSNQREHLIVEALRRKAKLAISLVATDGADIIAHVAISPVTISSGVRGWYGLGPLSVMPGHQGQGVGSNLVRAALLELEQELQAAGCVVLGDPDYYGRFGFKAYDSLELVGVPKQFFQALSFSGTIPDGIVSYDEAFDGSA